jgi:two-component system, NarL family, response regulator LiaR
VVDPKPIRVLLVDDHKMVRSGLAMLLKGFSDLELVGEASNGEEGVRLCAELQPDVVLMDLVMPEMDGVAATQQIRQKYPNIQVIALTSFKDKEHVQGALQAGANGYLLKDASVDELVNAIRAAKLGKPTLAWEATQALIKAAATPTPPEHDLTERERETLVLIAEGLTNRQIAGRLEISPFTVNAHVSNILSKLGAASRTEAVSLALQHNLLD